MQVRSLPVRRGFSVQIRRTPRATYGKTASLWARDNVVYKNPQQGRVWIFVLRDDGLVQKMFRPEGCATTNGSAKLAQHGHGTEQAQ